MEIEQKIGYTFKNKQYINTALTHSSYANEAKKEGVAYNERLEFLGDSVLSLIVSHHLFTSFNMPEGDLTKIRASLVCETSLAIFARQIDLGKYLRLGKGEERMGGRERDSILADAFEAVIAAIYMDGGMEPARKFVMNFIHQALEKDIKVPFEDYKTHLQEIIQKNPEEILTYRLVEESGPDHDKKFVVQLYLNSNMIGVGEGRNKKAAEQMAAKQALELMGE